MKKGDALSLFIVCIGLVLAFMASSYQPQHQHDSLALMIGRVMVFFKTLLFPLGVAALLKYIAGDR